MVIANKSSILHMRMLTNKLYMPLKDLLSWNSNGYETENYVAIS